ncbi:hypothetical protein [Klebsiella phage 05F01]|nr:hypothetical protein [Klebsiella phage 05F01]
MAKTPKKSSVQKKEPKTSSKSSSKPIRKEKFDTEAFVFNTPIKHIEEALERLEEQDNDDMAEPLTKDQIYWWGIWTLQLPDAKKRGLETVPTCAKENAVLKLPKIKK